MEMTVKKSCKYGDWNSDNWSFEHLLFLLFQLVCLYVRKPYLIIIM